MDWNAVGAVGEILGAVAVFLTLLYLATQIKQTNKMARFEATREIMAQFNACNHLCATDATIREVLLKKASYRSRKPSSCIRTWICTVTPGQRLKWPLIKV